MLPYLELDHFLRGETQVHAVTALELEGTFVELGDGLVHVQQGVLLCHLPDDLQGGSIIPGMVPVAQRHRAARSMCLTSVGMAAYQGRQGDAGGRADELDHGAIVDIPFPRGELAPSAALISLVGRREAESPPRVAREQVNLGCLAMHRSGRAPSAFLLLSLLCRCSLLGETTAPREPSTGEGD